MTEKKQLRKMVLSYRRMLSRDEYDKRNTFLRSALFRLIKEERFKCIHTFLPIDKNKEFDVTPLLPDLWGNDVKIMVPESNFEDKTLKHFWLTPETQLQKNKFGIPEPVEAKEASFSEAEAILIPLIAVDRNGNRFGYGGGFYDRLLQSFKGNVIGISLSPLFDQLGTDPWDIPVNRLIFYKGDHILKLSSS